MSKIISIGTAVPAYRHQQSDILQFMQRIYASNEADKRRMRFLYYQSAITTRYSVVPDYSRSLPDWKFYPQAESLDPFPNLEQRMTWYNRYAAPLSIQAIRDCIDGKIRSEEITHLITVSCTGMSAPGLDLQVMELLALPSHTWRTSVNFMGCYAAIHALKLADALCQADTQAKVLIVCTELCTLHFQRAPTMDNIASGLLFADGSAAALITHDQHTGKGLHIDSFYSEIIARGKSDMSWELSSSGFQMTLSTYVPELIEADFEPLISRALKKSGIEQAAITHWCIHPGGRKILEAIQQCLQLDNNALNNCYEVLQQYGNMSSPTLLFVLKKILHGLQHQPVDAVPQKILGAAFGPGLTMETFVSSYA